MPTINITTDEADALRSILAKLSPNEKKVNVNHVHVDLKPKPLSKIVIKQNAINELLKTCPTIKPFLNNG